MKGWACEFYERSSHTRLRIKAPFLVRMEQAVDGAWIYKETNLENGFFLEICQCRSAGLFTIDRFPLCRL